MKFDKVHKQVGDIPFISDLNAKKLYQFIIKEKPTHILELGFAHGTASCYMAAALDEIGIGKLNSVDLQSVKDHFKPSIEAQLRKLSLDSYVEIYRMKSGYNWFLHDEIKTQTNKKTQACEPKYDLIIIDGPKNWTIDSSSFFLCEKLLKPNGWIIWDDYNWTYEAADQRRDSTDGILHSDLSLDEKRLPHIKEIIELLVLQHPNFNNFIIQEDTDWVWAQKSEQSTSKKIHYTYSKSFKFFILNWIKKLFGISKRKI